MTSLVSKTAIESGTDEFTTVQKPGWDGCIFTAKIDGLDRTSEHDMERGP